MLTPYKVRITVVKKTFHEDLVDEYTEGVKWEPKNCCHAFEIGHEVISDGHMPEGFSDWAWTDIQKYVMTLARGGNMLGVKPRRPTKLRESSQKRKEKNGQSTRRGPQQKQ